MQHNDLQTAYATRAEEVARVAYGRLLAILASRDGDIEAAEDELADAFAQALQSWSRTGVPQNPEAWLLTAARNRRIDLQRSAAYRLTGSLDDASRGDALPAVHMRDVDEIPDRRLALLFVCAHPAIDPAARTALMLQVVLGFEADRIAHAFAVQSKAMAQRLVRAKRRIRDARIPFVVPERGQMQERLTPVLEAIYGAYAMEFPLVAGTTERESLADEALFLSSTLAELLPNEAEALGLAALISLSLARRPAGGDGLSFVPLEEQDVSQWDEELIASGESYLYRASALNNPGRFQTEAAIQSVHCARARTGTTDWRTLRTLFSVLLELAPTLGARVALAAAIGRTDGPRAGLASLEAIAGEAVLRFQPAWATRAHLLEAAGVTEAAVSAFDRAITLTADQRSRAYLQRRRDSIRPLNPPPTTAPSPPNSRACPSTPDPHTAAHQTPPHTPALPSPRAEPPPTPPPPARPLARTR